MFEWLWLIAGPAVLLKESVTTTANRAEGQYICSLEEEFEKEFTDYELEEQTRKGLDGVTSKQGYALWKKMWDQIETYQRDNPVIAWKRCYKGHEVTPKINRFLCGGGGYVGKERLPFWDSKGRYRGSSSYGDNELHDNREYAISLFVWTHGKMTAYSASHNAKRIYSPQFRNRRRLFSLKD